MPQMNGSGPNGEGPKTGRGIGMCNENTPEDLLSKIGKGQGKRRRSSSEPGEGKRFKSVFSFFKFLK